MITQPISILVFLLFITSVSAQTALESSFARQLQPTPSQLGEVSQADQKLVISKVATTLQQHISFSSSMTASSHMQTTSGRNEVEWKNLRINQLIPTRITDSDLKIGVTKRIQATLTYDASRVKDTKTDRWNTWGTSTHPLFPPAITIVWRNGQPVVEAGPYLSTFKPGNAPAQATAKTQTRVQPQEVASNTPARNQEPRTKNAVGIIKPASSLSLPPGMQRR